MKKKFLMFLCTLCFIIPVSFVFTGCNNKTPNYVTYNVNFDYGKASSFFKSTITEDSVKSNEWITTIPEIKDEYKDSFLGWFVKGSDTEVKNYSIIGANCTLEARFDINKAPSGLYQKGKYVMTWEEVTGSSNKTELSGDLVLDDSFDSQDDFSNCVNLTNVIIPKGLTYFNYSSFKNCTGLTEIVIPETVTKIYGSMFKNCTNIKKVTLNGNVDTLSGVSVFEGCINIEEVVIAEGVRHLGCMFAGCDSIETINLPASLEYIDNFAFKGCSALKELYIPSNVCHIGEGVFAGCDSLGIVYVSKLNDTFVDTSDDYANRSIIINKETNTIVAGQLFHGGEPAYLSFSGIIGKGAFRGNNVLTKLIVSANKIEDLAFLGCENLEEVEISENITEISSCAFYGCSMLEKFTLKNQDGFKWQISIDSENETWVDVSTLDNETLLEYLTTKSHCCLKQVLV